MRLIDADALKKALHSNCDLCHDKNTNWCENCCPHNDFEDLIDNAPTVEFPEQITMKFDCETEEDRQKLLSLIANRPQAECDKCDYYSLSQAFINGIVEVMSKYGITTIDELLETLKGGAE